MTEHHLATFDTETRTMRVTRADGTAHAMNAQGAKRYIRVLQSGDTFADALAYAGLTLAEGATWHANGRTMIAPVLDAAVNVEAPTEQGVAERRADQLDALTPDSAVELLVAFGGVARHMTPSDTALAEAARSLLQARGYLTPPAEGSPTLTVFTKPLESVLDALTEYGLAQQVDARNDETYDAAERRRLARLRAFDALERAGVVL